MRLWLLKRSAQWPEYDVNNGFVIRAATETDARQLAAGQRGDEGAETWLDSALSTCEPLTDDGPAEIVLLDFNAG